MDAQPYGSQFCACIVKMIEDHDYKLENDKDRIKLLLSTNEDTSEEIITYYQLLEYLAKDDNNDIIWKFKRIVSHQGPLTPKHHIIKDQHITSWLNGRMGIPQWNHCRSLQRMTL
jgi:hypothetical protein